MLTSITQSTVITTALSGYIVCQHTAAAPDYLGIIDTGSHQSLLWFLLILSKTPCFSYFPSTSFIIVKNNYKYGGEEKVKEEIKETPNYYVTLMSTSLTHNTSSSSPLFLSFPPSSYNTRLFRILIESDFSLYLSFRFFSKRWIPENNYKLL